MHTIQFEFPLSIGQDGVDTSETNPLSRAFSALLASGKDHKTQTFCYLNFPGDSNPSAHLRWLGVFIHSSGDRILFFPGLDVPIDWVETVRDGSDPVRRTFKLDHFSAEPERYKWHITSPGSNEHIPGGRTRQADRDSYYWLGLSLQNYSSFLPAYKCTYVTHNSPPSDVGRRTSILRELEQSTNYAQVKIDNQEHFDYSASFIHMNFIFSRPSAPNYVGPEWLLPIGSPYLVTQPPDLIPNIRLHRIPLSSSWDIQIATMLVPGIISRAVVFTSPASL